MLPVENFVLILCTVIYVSLSKHTETIIQINSIIGFHRNISLPVSTDPDGGSLAAVTASNNTRPSKIKEKTPFMIAQEKIRFFANAPLTFRIPL